MSLAQQRQRFLAFLIVLVVLSVLFFGLAAFEIGQHMNGIWHMLTTMQSIACDDFVSHH